MSVLKTQDQGIIILSQQDYLPILVESFLIDCANAPSVFTVGVVPAS